MSLRAKLLFGIAGVLGLMMVLSTGTYYLQQRMDGALARSARSEELRARISALQLAATDYLSRGNPEDRALWTSSIEELLDTSREVEDAGELAVVLGVSDIERTLASLERAHESLIGTLASGEADGNVIHALSNVERRLILQLQSELAARGQDAGLIVAEAHAEITSIGELQGRLILLLSVLLPIAAAGFGGWLFVDTARPIARIAGTVEAIADGDLDARVGRGGSGELATLGSAVDRMTERLQASIGRLEREVAERRAAEGSLRESETRSRAILDTASDAIFTVDEEGAIQSANAATEELFGYAAEELPGQSVTLLVPGAYRGEQDGSSAHGRGTRERGMTGLGREVAGRRKDGTEFPLHLSVSEARMGEKRIFTGIARDLTELKQAENELRALNHTLEEQVAERTAAAEARSQELARSNAELEQFAYVASHDLQEPLRMVASFTQLLARRYGDELDEQAHEYIQYAVDGAQRMQGLINDLLAYSRVGTRGKELEPMELEGALDAALSNLQIAIEESGAEITRDPMPAVEGDQTQLTQVLQNLVGNAIKFRGEEPPRIHVGAERAGEGWEITVRDHGIGIQPEYAERIFVIFQRLHTRDQYEGTGIGLAVCRKVVERHGGQIWVESTPGAGSTFHFTLRPAVEALAAA